MNQSKTRLAAKGIVTGFINKIVTMFLPFIVRTIMIYTIGVQYIGLNSVFTSILSILSFAELGFGNVMVYSMYKPIADKDNKKLSALLNLYKKLYRIIGTVILAVGLAIMPFIRKFIHGEYPSDVNLYVLYLIFLFNSVISYWLFAYKSSMLSAHQMYYVTNNISTVISIMMNAGEILALLLIRNYYVYVIMIPLATIANNLYVAYITKKMYPDIIPSGTVDKETSDDIRKNVLSGIGHKLGPTATTSIDNLVVSSYAGLVLAGVYNNYNYIITTVTAFVSLVFGNFVAGIGNSLLTESPEKNYEDFKFFTFLNSLLVGWSAVCILCLSQSFMWLWVGRNNGEEYMYSMTAVIILVIMYYVQQIRAIVTSYKTAAGMWYADRLKPYVATIANAILDIVLFPIFGVEGILLSTIFARAAIGIPWETNAFFKGYFKQPQIPYYLTIVKYALVTVVVGIISYFVCRILPDYNWWWLLIKGIVCSLCSAALFLVIYVRNPHMKRLFSFICRKLKRITSK